MPEETLFETEQPWSRTDVAALFARLSEQLAADKSFTLTVEDRIITAVVPEQLQLEIELEREWEDDQDDETTEADADGSAIAEPDVSEVSLELELTWEERAEAELKTDVTDSTTTAPADHDSTGAPTDDQTERSASHGRFHVYRDRAGEWRWRLVHRNGNIIATSGEGYASRQNARKGLRSVRVNAPAAEIVVE